MIVNTLEGTLNDETVLEWPTVSRLSFIGDKQDLSVVILNVTLKTVVDLRTIVPTAGLRWTKTRVVLLNDSQHFVTLIGYLTIIVIIVEIERETISFYAELWISLHIP